MLPSSGEKHLLCWVVRARANINLWRMHIAVTRSIHAHEIRILGGDKKYVIKTVGKYIQNCN
jgi:hypothetical protein